MSSFEFYNKNIGKNTHVNIELDPKDNSEILNNPDISQLTYQRIIANSLPFLQKSGDHAAIRIHHIDKATNELSYQIEGEAGLPIHKISLDVPHVKAEADKIAKNKIVPVGSFANQNVKSLLRRFAKDEPMPKGFFATIKWILSKFFEKLRKQFAFIDMIWEGITHESAKRLKWDINLLAEVVGDAPTEHISMHEALKYLCKLLEREEGQGNDKELKKRLETAVKISRKQNELRNHFSKSKLEEGVNALLHQINTLQGNDKILMPVGYYDSDHLQEMLLEIGKDDGNMFTITLISSSKDVRTFFDREHNPNGGKQSIRRTILNIHPEDLKNRLSLMLELTTSPFCAANPDHSWRSLFFETLKFPGSTIAYTPPTEKFSNHASSGTMKELMTYLDDAQVNKEEGQRFDLTMRLRLFLDVCQASKKSWNNAYFRSLVRKTVLELAKEIESNKALLGNAMAQGTELSDIFLQLKDVQKALEDPLQVPNPALQTFRNVSGRIDMENSHRTSMLSLKRMNLTEAADIDPPLVLLDKDQFAKTIETWSARFKQLSVNKLFDTAANEAKLIARMLPSWNDPFWPKLSVDERRKFIALLNDLSNALSEHAEESGDAAIEDLMAIVTLNYCGYRVAAQHSSDHNKEIRESLVEELMKCRISPDDKQKLKSFYNSKFGPQEPPRPSIGLGILCENLNKIWKINRATHKGTPLHLQHPDYAKNIADEITNRYTTQQCPLGCTRDNCPNYAQIDKSEHRFHPLYMAHNFVNIFAPKSIEDGLTRTEALDLLYTQTTLQSAHNLINDMHSGLHGTAFAHGFDKTDNVIQIMQTWTAFMRHPDFFKSAELRWHFETKLFIKDAFDVLMDDEHLPFFHNLLKQLAKEIKVVYASGDVEKCAYLIYVQERISTLIKQHERPSAPGVLVSIKKEDLLALLLPDAEMLLHRLFRDSISQKENLEEDAQIVLYSIYINLYFERFCNHDTAFLRNNDDLINLMMMAQRIESMKNSYDKMDPILIDRYQALIGMVYPAIKQECLNPKNGLVNSLLSIDHPLVAAKQLTWEILRFPIVCAFDEEGIKHHYNLKTGEVSIGHLRADSLPDLVLKDPSAQKVFGAALDDDWSMLVTPIGLTAQNTTAYSHPSFPDYRISIVTPKNKKKTVIVERNIANFSGEKEWTAYARFRDQDRILKGEEVLSADDLPTQVAAAIGNRDCWIGNRGKTVYVMEGKSADLFAIINLTVMKNDNGTNETYVNSMIFREGKTSLLHPNRQALERFTTIESERFIQVKGKNKHAEELEYLRYEIAGSGAKIKYQISANEITSLTFPGFNLAVHGTRPGSKDPSFSVKPLPDTFDEFQYLKKNDREKILLPMRPFVQQFDVKGHPIPYSKVLPSNDFSIIPVFEYDVDKETNRLKATSSQAYAYLAYVCMTHNDFGSAKYYLGKAATSTGYSQEHDQVMSWIAHWKDTSPNEIAMRLHFALHYEKVIEDRRNLAIANGELIKMEELDFNRPARLAAISKSYRSYMKIKKQPEVDLSLTLSPEQHIQLQKLVKEFLAKHGTDLVNTKEVIPLRAANISQYNYLNEDTKDPLINQKATMLLWSQRIGEKGLSPVAIKSPLWIVQNFADIFNKLYKTDIHSAEFKQLELQIEVISQISMDSLNEVEKETVELAQSYLLKMISAKKNQPVIFNQFPDFFKENGLRALPDFYGPWFTSSRNKMIDMAAYAAKRGIFTETGLKNKRIALQQVLSVEWNEKNPKDIKLRNLMKGVDTFIKDYAGNDKQFYTDYRMHLLERFYGKHAAKNIFVIDSILKVLEPIPVVPVRQHQQKGPAFQTKDDETNAARYTPLLTATPPPTSAAEIAELKAVLFKGNEVRQPMVVTPADQCVHVLGVVVKEIDDSRALKVVSVPPPNIDRTVFNVLKNSTELAVVRHATEHEKDLDAALKEKKVVTSNRVGVESIKQKLTLKGTQVDEEIEVLRKDLMQFCEHFDTPAGILAMRRLTGKSIKLNIDTLIALWRTGEITNQWEDNPFKAFGMKAITPENLKEIDAKIQQYLMATTSRGHLQRYLVLVEEYLKTCGPNKLDEGDKALAFEIYEALETKRSYSPNDPDARDFLFMENALGIILRNGQIETFREMVSNPNAVRQLNMGGGKSKVILPLLAKRKANGQNLVMLVLPDELFETNCRDLDATNRMLFGQEMHRFVFSRSSNKNLESLQQQHLRLLKTIKETGFVMTTKRSLLSFRNAYIEKLYALKNSKPADVTQKNRLLAEIREMNSILHLFKNHTDVISDEIDACLDIRKEMNFSLGATSPVNQIKKDVGIQVMETILEAKEGPLSKLRETLINNTQGSLSSDEIALAMEDAAKKFLQKNHLGFDEKGFVDYMMDRPSGMRVKMEVDKLKNSNDLCYKQITALKGFINIGFCNTLHRVGRVNYGRDPVSGIWTIPFKASEAAQINSEFDEEIERIAFTIQDYIQFGITYKQLYQKIAELHNRAANELRIAKEDPDNLMGLNDTQAASDFVEFMKKIDPTGKAGSKLTLAAVTTPKRVKALVDTINSSPESRLAYLNNMVLDQMQQTNLQINSDSGDFTDMVRNFSGFTGTPYNLRTFDDKIEALKNLGVDGQTWALMLSRNIPIETFDFNPKKPTESLLTELKIIGNRQALVDTGAYLRGVTNEAFIDAAMKSGKEKGIRIDGGIYFDDSGKIVKKTDLDRPALALESAPETELRYNITLYDQAHTVGADIKQWKKAVATVTIGENTFIRDLFQAVRRLRELDKEQTFTLAVSNQIKDKILGGQQRDLTINDILIFCQMNEIKRESEDNFRSEKNKISNAAKKAALNIAIELIQMGMGGENIIKTASILTSEEEPLLLKKRIDEEAFDSYGQMKTEEKSQEQLARLKTSEAETCTKVANKFYWVDRKAETALKAVGKTIKERPDRPLEWMPNMVNASLLESNKELELETMAQIELTLEINTEINKELHVTKENELVIPMVTSGAAGSGDVYSIKDDVLYELSSGTLKDNLRRVNNLCHFFDKEIYCTEVFERNLPSTFQQNADPQSMFYTNRKTPNYGLIFKDSNSTFRMVIPTVHEAHDACREFTSKNTDGSTAVVVSMVPAEPTIFYKSGKDRTGNLPFVDEKERKAFYRLYVQLKLFNGEIDFPTKDEKEALTAWLKEKGAKEFKSYFEQNILSTKPRHMADAYPDSSLIKVFDGLMVPAVA